VQKFLRTFTLAPGEKAPIGADLDVFL